MTELLLDPEEVRAWAEEAEYDPKRMTRIAVAALRERAANGDVNADLVLFDWTVAGGMQRLKRTLTGLRTVAVPSRSNGPDFVPLPKRLSIGGDDGSRRLKDWSQLTLFEFKTYLRDYRAQTTTRIDVLQTLERIATVWSEHPDVSGDEALRLAGIDPAEISVEAIAL